MPAAFASSTRDCDRTIFDADLSLDDLARASRACGVIVEDAADTSLSRPAWSAPSMVAQMEDPETDVPPEQPETDPGETLDLSVEARTAEASRHADREAREQKETEGPPGGDA
jgi:hypothetical protein